jgi:glycolate oxidase iron-sulfur subunit
MRNYRNELYTHNLHLKELITKNGVKDIYDAVSQCTRCGYCLENCPTYLVGKKETLSPRGRNQIVRMLIEGKYTDVNTAKYTIDTCLLCGACTDVCYGKVQTEDIVLEARREEQGHNNSLIYKIIIYLKCEKKLFDICLKFLFFLHRIKLSYLADKLGLFYLLGYPSLSKGYKKLIKTPKKFLHTEIKHLTDETDIKWIYFATCGTDYLFTNVGRSSINVLKKIYGNGVFMNNECCGLISYNYGSLDDARKLATKNIELYEKIKAANPDAFIVGDCSSCIAFMKTYPQMFMDDENMYKRAVDFSSNVRDIIEVVKPEHIKNINFDYIKDKKVTIHHSCKAYNNQDLKTNEDDVLKPVLKENLIEMNESNLCCGGAGAYAFSEPEFSAAILSRKMTNISITQADITLVSATSCLMQIGYGSKTSYHTEVMHYIEFIDRIMV